MYNFIFYFFYTNFERFKNKKAGDSRIRASGFFLVLLIMQLFFLLSIIRYVFDIRTRWDLHGLGFQLCVLFVCALSGFGIFKYYNDKRMSKIEQKYSGVKILTFKNSVLVALLFFVPMIASIIITKLAASGSVFYHGN